MPPVGLLVAALVYLGALSRGTKVYGVIVILLRIYFLAYVYLFFHGGTISIQVPPKILQGVLRKHRGRAESAHATVHDSVNSHDRKGDRPFAAEGVRYPDVDS